MKIFLTDREKVDIYSLPSKAEDEFLINYRSTKGIEETITITAENNQWYVASTYDVTFYHNTKAITKEPLTNNIIYQLKFNDLEENLMFYCYDTPMNYFNFLIGDKKEITLGRTGNCDIIYDHAFIVSPHLRIFRLDNNWYIEDTANGNNNIYVNQKRVTSTILHAGDVIFANGLKIIWMNIFISINNPNNKISVSLQQYKDYFLGVENKYTEVKESEKNISLYDDNAVFFHTPRLKDDIVPKIIKIDNPPEEIKPDDTPLILTYGATMMMGLSSSVTGVMAVVNIVSGTATLLSTISQLSICISMLAGCILFPILLDKYRKRKLSKNEERRQKKYTDYLNKKQEEINIEMKTEVELLFKNNLNVEECKNIIVNKQEDLWKREILDNDFLNIRLGLGDKNTEITIEAALEDFSLNDDNLKNKVKEIKNTPLTLQNVPITISLTKDNVLPIVIDDDFAHKKQYIDWICLQLLTYYSGIDLKIVILTTQENEKKWEYFKYLSHCYIHDKKLRLFATNEEEFKIVTSYLESIYQERFERANSSGGGELKNTEHIENSDKFKLFDSYYLIITDDYIETKKYKIIQDIINNSKNLGFSLITFEKTMSTIPSRFEKFIEITDDHSRIYSKTIENNQKQTDFIPEYFTDDINDYARIISNIPTISSSNASSLPSSVNFLEMYKVGKIEQLNIVNRWQNNNPVQSLHAPLGVRENGKLIELDLHEKFHGPHGLIAGSTGSGKSEFIITFILSMAINYHPYEVQFVLIDYKGGGLAGAFENKDKGIKIPHLVGTITNLDTNEMNRTLVSINSELKRREKIFNKARDMLGESTIDIYKYQKFYREGKLKEPVSHLFIISDEFAELKAQQPDFMDELVSTARIGRSLGVHLILATQKPSGVVNDQIWSNSRFKVCLKVQTAEDSTELLKRPEAAAIKETGRFYLQVGYNELFELGQAAWAGARYMPTERIQKSLDDSIEIIDHNGNVIKRVNDKVISENTVDLGDQLTNVVKYLYNIAQRDNIGFSSLWLPSIPEEIYLPNIIDKYQYKANSYQIVPIIGEYDNPASQIQNILTIDLTNSGNLIIYGNVGSGKENLLSTLIYSICVYHSSEEVNFYIFDFGSEILKVFKDFPQVGDISLMEDKLKIKSALLWLNRELARRKDLFSEYGGTYASYISTSGQKLPLIVNILNGYESFVETYSNLDDFLQSILRESSKYGIIFVVTANGLNSVRSSTKNLFNNKLAMKLTDVTDYKYEFKAPYGLIPANYFGRGIITIDNKGYEFQTCLINKKDNINEVIKNTASKLQEVYKKANKIPVIPERLTADTMISYIDTLQSVPLGINIFNANIETYDFKTNKITSIIGNNVLTNIKFINDFISTLQSIPHTTVKVIDFMELGLEISGDFHIIDQYTPAINNIITDNQESNEHIVYLFIGISKVYNYVLPEGIEELFNIFQNPYNYEKLSFVVLDNFIPFKKIMKETWSVNLINGIWLGGDVEAQNILKINHLSSNDSNENYNGLAYIIENGDYKVIKTMGVSGEEYY